MSKKNDGGSAFPVQHTVADANDPAFKLGCCGMSLRDYFASMAIGEWTRLIAERGLTEKLIESIGLKKDSTNAQATAKLCYMIADAMLNEREK